MPDESKTIQVGTAPGVVPDDMSRDVAMVRNPRSFHKIPPEIARNDELVWGGHPVFSKSTGYIVNLALSYSDTETSRSVARATEKKDISSYVPTGLKNIRGVLIHLLITAYIAATKTKLNSKAIVQPRFSYTYDDTPTSNNRLMHLLTRCYSTDADNQQLQNEIGGQCFCPVVYRGAVPYIILNTWNEFADMTSVDEQYITNCYVYLQGFFI